MEVKKGSVVRFKLGATAKVIKLEEVSDLDPIRYQLTLDRRVRITRDGSRRSHIVYTDKFGKMGFTDDDNEIVEVI